jgi:lipopolysaccharide transport system ATP-binding protein
MASIRTSSLGVRFAFDRQERPVTPAMARVRRRCSHAWGLRDVTLQLYPGETVALLGRNGAGKTTLLKALAGVYPADEGMVECEGRIGSLLAVGAGLLPALTGRENAVLLGVLAGLTRRQATASLPAVELRAGLGDAFDRPVAGYSQGMTARIGLAVIEQIDPQVLLLDEVHEALDAGFRESLADLAREIAAKGGIVVAAGHDLHELGQLCEQSVLLDKGRVRAQGAFDVVAGLTTPAPDSGELAVEA